MRLSLLASLGLFLNLANAHPLAPNDFETRSAGNGSEIIMFTPDDIHSNVLAGLSPDRITTTSELYEFIQLNSASLSQEEDKSVYLKDTRTWVTLEDLPAENNTVEARQGSCYTTVNRQVLYGHAYWAPWHAVTSCLKSDKSPNGGYLSVTYEDSVAVTYSAGLSFGGFEGAIGLSVGFSITYGYSEAATYACNVGAYDTVQLWARHRHGWASVRSQSCRICPESSYCPAWTSGYINAASSRSNLDKHQWGCSAQSVSHLKC